MIPTNLPTDPSTRRLRRFCAPARRGVLVVAIKPALILSAALCLAIPVSGTASTNIWTGASGIDQNWSTGANWTNGVAPYPTNDVFFSVYGAAGTAGPNGTVNNIVDVNTTLQSLWFTNNPADGLHTMLINPGVTLTVTGAQANAIFVGTTIDVAGTPSVNATINGPGGALFVTNASGTISVRQASVTSGAKATLDLRGLDTLTAYVSQFLVGGENVGKDQVVTYFAQTNFITCFASGTTAGLVVGNNNTSGSKNDNIYLGTTNVILSDGGMELPVKRMNAYLAFTSSGSAAFFRNRAGTGAQDHWYIGFNNTGGTGTGANGGADFSNGTLDAMVKTLIVGASQTATGSGSGNGTMTFSGGSLVCSSVDIGEQMASGNPTSGTININDNNGPAQLTVNGTLRLARYQGGSSVPAGTLNVSGTGGSSITVNGNIVCGSAGKSTINFNNSSLTLAGTMGASDSPVTTLNFYSGALTFNFNGSPNPATAVCTVNTLDLENPNGPCALTVLGSGLAVGQFPLFAYQSLLGLGAEAFTLALPSQIQGYLSNNVATSSIDLVITNVFSPIWNGLPNGNWDINTTANWMTPSGTVITYHQAGTLGDLVTFDDRANGTTAINLTTTLSPTSVVVNNTAKNYTYSGVGQLSGSAGLSKNGTGSLKLANSGSNSFTGPVTISGGSVQLGVANGLPTNSTVTLADATGTLLDLNNFNQTIGTLSGGGPNGGDVSLGNGTLTIAGSAGHHYGIISGNGGLVVASSGLEVLYGANLYAGGTLISTGTLAVANSYGYATGTGGVDIEGGTLNIGNGTSGGGSVAGTITNNGYITFNRADDMTFANPIVGSGAVFKYLTDNVTLSGPNNYSGGTSINDGTLTAADSNALGSGLITVSYGSNPQLDLVGGITLTNSVLVNSKSGTLNGNNPVVRNVYGTNTLAGPLLATSSGTDISFESDSDELILTGPFTYQSATSHQNIRLRGMGMGEWHGSIANTTNGQMVALYKQDSGTWTLTGSSTNTYTDQTQISGGTLVVNGSILNSSTVYVNFGATLSGTGLIGRPVSLTGATLSPGAAPDLGSIGTLTISNSLTFDPSSTANFDLSAVGGVVANDQVAGLTGVTFDGTLNLNLVGAVKGGEVFKLFSAASYSGIFAIINLPSNPLPPPLAWNTDGLTVDGTVRVEGIGIANGVRLSNGAFQLNGTVPAVGAGLSYRVLAATDISTPFNSWVQVGSGTFAGGPFTFTDANAMNYPKRFYIIVTP